MCRWLAHMAEWGTLATTTPGGAPYGGVVSVSDGPAEDPTGRLLFYLTPMDRTTQHLEAGGGASALVLAEASQLPGGCGGTDPESPVCARVTALGRTRKVAPEGADEAMRLLVARHPEMGGWAWPSAAAAARRWGWRRKQLSNRQRMSPCRFMHCCACAPAAPPLATPRHPIRATPTPRCALNS
jgi:hypothetical protein